jgi:hypothetical protein
MILMIDLDAIQSMIMGKHVQHARRQQMLTSATPGVGDYCQSPGLMNQLNATFQLDRVTGYVRWSAVGQEPVERLLPITDMASFDKRVGYVRATHRGTVTYLSHHLCFANWRAKGGQLGQYASQPAQPTVTDSGHLCGQPRTVRISPIRQEVHAAALARAGELHSAYQLNALPRTLSLRFIEPIEGVMVSQADYVEPGYSSVAHQLGWSVCSVRHRGMRMQVNPHTSDLSRRPA